MLTLYLLLPSSNNTFMAFGIYASVVKVITLLCILIFNFILLHDSYRRLSFYCMDYY